jgi:hypothetical protein
MRRAKDGNARLISRATALKGTAPGERSVAIGRREFIRPEHGEAVDAMTLYGLSTLHLIRRA